MTGSGVHGSSRSAPAGRISASRSTKLAAMRIMLLQKILATLCFWTGVGRCREKQSTRLVCRNFVNVSGSCRRRAARVETGPSPHLFQSCFQTEIM